MVNTLSADRNPDGPRGAGPGLLDRAAAGERLGAADAETLFRDASLLELGRAADAVRRRLHPDGVVTYVVDRNINYTNVCVSRCRFCAFFRDPGSPEAYVLDTATLHAKVAETLARGGTGILLQGGLHPDFRLPWYEDLLRGIRERFAVDLHCFSPPEIVHIARLSGVGVEECLRRLVAAGLSSLPGGGAEILCDAHRQRVSPAKCTADEWLDVMECAHRLGLRTTATMMFGSGESVAERVEHLDRLRRLQDRTGGFVAFIPWSFAWRHTDLAAGGGTFDCGGVEYLKMVALSRLYLDNFPAIQASWVTQGLKVAQVALRFGADDMGSVMMEENVVAAAGVSHRTTEGEIRRLVGDAGFRPVRRDNSHRHLS